MIVNCFSQKMSADEALKIAGKRNGFFTRLITGNHSRDIEMRTIYIENRLITFDITAAPSLVAHIFKKDSTARKSKIEMIANGSTCGVAYYDRRDVEIGPRDVDEEALQLSDFPDSDFITRGNALARRILRRRVGGNMSLEVAEIKSVFRPYHVAFFGKPSEGRKVHYLPIAADGCSVKRTF